MHVIIHLLTVDYPKPRKLIMDINIYNTLDFLNNHTIKRIPVF